MPLIAVFREIYDVKLERMLGGDAKEYRERADAVNRIIERKLFAMMPPGVRQKFKPE